MLWPHVHVESEIWEKWTYLWNRLTDTEDQLVSQGGGCWRWVDWEFGVSICRQLHTEWINNRVLQLSTENYIQRPMMHHDGKEFFKRCKLTSLSNQFLGNLASPTYFRGKSGFTCCPLDLWGSGVVIRTPSLPSRPPSSAEHPREHSATWFPCGTYVQGAFSAQAAVEKLTCWQREWKRRRNFKKLSEGLAALSAQ